MTDAIHITLPLTGEAVAGLRAGQRVLLSGEILLARDAAHELLCGAISRGESPPVELRGAVVYYCGPTETPPGRVVGSAGPTTSSRMDAFTPALLRYGLRGMIGKGARSDAVRDAVRETDAVYFETYGGAGALLAQCFVTCEIAAYPELGTEAVRRATVRDFPAIVRITGN
jgi:fumarate hydratase subunit beta